jgi:type IV pilus assembly protein PilB
VHFEPGPDGVRVRFRVDGVLRAVDGAPLAGHSSAMSVIKILAGVDGAQGSRAHHGRFSVAHGDRTVSVTLSTLPTSDGEVAVLHVDDEAPRVRELSALGLSPEQRESFETALKRPQGLIIAGGQAGSGKRATVDAALAELNRPDRSVVALDNEARNGPSRDLPDGVKQVRVDPRSGITAAAGVQSAIRADADVILVGALEEADTTRAAVDAARVGRVVLATVDAARAAAIPLRLVDLGIEPFLVASAVTFAVAQRLVRQLCTRCSEPDEPDAAERDHLRLPDDLVEGGAIRRAVGCEHCGGTGYRGRLAIFEVMPMTEAVARLVATGGTSRDIERWAVADGMDTLRMSAFRRVADGVLSLDEMSRVLG